MTRNLMRSPFSIVASMILCIATQSTIANEPLVFISAFASGDDGAIHAYRLNPGTGQLRPIHRTTDAEHPFFLAVSPDGKYLYSIHAPGEFGEKNMNKSLHTKF